jgi:hypothetical protein
VSHHFIPTELLRRIGPHEWMMLDHGRHIAHLEQLEVQVGDHYRTCIRASTWAIQPDERLFIGYFVDLLMASTILWGEWLKEGRFRELVARIG